MTHQPANPPQTDALSSGASERRLRSIDVWRGIAALAVLAIHIDHYAHGGWREHPFFFPAFLIEYGYVGVPLFVVISGFCIHRRAAYKRAQTGTYQLNWLQFWKRRFWRLYPAYVAAIAFSLVLAFAVHHRFSELSTSWPADLACHLLLVHNLTESYNTTLGNGAFWSLGMEEQLYLLYIPLFALLAYRSPRRTLLVVSAVTVVWLWMIPLWDGESLVIGPFALGSWHAWPFAYWLNWTLGAVAVDAYLGNTPLPRWTRSARIAALCIGLGLLMNQNFFELLHSTNLVRSAGFDMIPRADSLIVMRMQSLSSFVWALAFFCLINWGLSRETDGGFRNWSTIPLAGVGRFSYSLYLTHVPVVYVLEKYFPFGYSPSDWLLRYVVYGSAALAVGYVFFLAIERRFLIAVPRRAERPLDILQPSASLGLEASSEVREAVALETR